MDFEKGFDPGCVESTMILWILRKNHQTVQFLYSKSYSALRVSGDFLSTTDDIVLLAENANDLKNIDKVFVSSPYLGPQNILILPKLKYKPSVEANLCK